MQLLLPCWKARVRLQARVKVTSHSQDNVGPPFLRRCKCWGSSRSVKREGGLGSRKGPQPTAPAQEAEVCERELSALCSWKSRLAFLNSTLSKPQGSRRKELASRGDEGVVLNSQDSSPSTIIKGVGIGKKWWVLLPLKWGAWKKRLLFQTIFHWFTSHSRTTILGINLPLFGENLPSSRTHCSS